MKRNFITIIIALAAVCSSWAQETNNVTLQGSIQDSFLERGLFDCIVTLMRTDSTAVDASRRSMR